MTVCYLLRYFCVCLCVYLSFFEQILVVIYFSCYALGYKHRKKDILWIWCHCNPSYAPARVWPSSLAIGGDQQVHHIALMFDFVSYVLQLSYIRLWTLWYCSPSDAPARVWASSLAIGGEEQVDHIAFAGHVARQGGAQDVASDAEMQKGASMATSRFLPCLLILGLILDVFWHFYVDYRRLYAFLCLSFWGKRMLTFRLFAYLLQWWPHPPWIHSPSPSGPCRRRPWWSGGLSHRRRRNHIEILRNQSPRRIRCQIRWIEGTAPFPVLLVSFVFAPSGLDSCQDGWVTRRRLRKV